MLGSGSEDEDDEEAGPKGHTSLSPGELPHATDLALNSDSKTGQDDSEDQVMIVDLYSEGFIRAQVCRGETMVRNVSVKKSVFEFRLQTNHHLA